MATRAEIKERTREALLYAALQEFAEHGLDGPSLDQICARAGKTRGAFYVHFTDRESLVIAVVERILFEYLEALYRASEEADGLQAAITVFADLLERASRGDAPDLGRFAVLGTVSFRFVLEAGARIPAASEVFGRIVHAGIEMLGVATVQGQQKGRVRRDVEPRETGELLIAVLLGVLVFQQGGIEARVDKIRDTLIRILTVA
ncbi:MAG: TetR/AcrR family transcriptional regulator [Alphaproteobacteria bacterium]|nr:TetR/AcrR family transcriptional regulator [Alphaproteobacteria bacterium]